MRVIPKKIHILKFIGEQGIVTVFDVARHFFQPDQIATSRVTMHQLGVAHIYHPGIQHGVWFINKSQLHDLLNSYFPDLPQFNVRPVYHYQIPHYLELNRIRTTFEHSKEIIIDEWWSERYILALPAVIRRRFSNSKLSDAIFWRKKSDGSRQKYFLEYERTLKSKDRYEEIFNSYTKREDVQDRNVIYICQTPAIREELISIETKLGRNGKLARAGSCFRFITLEGFYNTYSNVSKEGSTNENDHTVAQNIGV